MKAIWFRQIDRPAEEINQILLKGDLVKRGCPLIKIYQQVEIARPGRFVSSYRAEDARIARMMETKQLQHVIALRADHLLNA